MKLKQIIKKKFLNADGTINKTVVASFITLLIVLIQQAMQACGFSYGHWDQVAAIINTILTILGLCGFVEGNGEVHTTIDTNSIKLNADNVTFSGKSFIPNQSGKEDNVNEE
ncbi:hypothetical protein H5S09_03635 [Limosilactobacillus sp. STM2_1]|uniref:Holin n=1 Tax=Limosilactobacillus rudii TaxID=2759755 RepID=A0A7W3UK91_9LACO|nr:hypothetical protein [Limosilactobacillus rudii]MBB1079081.1 hypothetical protein [Limosilactobacillus rudii]MBB1097044.1 hypothetical protein [Limosilactobacillus rudii]MCD7134012.1 hypothetical protein [Limosilactobacillus rudii]